MKDRKNKGSRKVFIAAFLAEALNLKVRYVRNFKIMGYYRPAQVLRYLKEYGYVPDHRRRKDKD